MQRWFPNVIFYVRAGGRVAKLARKLQLSVWEEAFVDRAYHDDGSLVARSESGAVLSNAKEIAMRIEQLFKKRVVESIDGAPVPMQAQTLCVHSDTLNAAKIAVLCRKVIDQR